MLNNKKILLGICGSIAAYKSAQLVRLLVKAGADVKVILTPDAANFVTPLTLSTLSKNPVFTKYFEEETGEWNNHVELALWADILLVAPLSANTLAKFASGLCDNLLTAVYLSAKCDVYLAPAMDLDMWKHESTQENIDKVLSFGNSVIEPESGELASGLIGQGRMSEPENIVAQLQNELLQKSPLNGKKAIVTAGPTYEAIDPVRFIGNHSSGKMGFEIAAELTKLGADVTLISGPTALVPERNISMIDVVSAQEMFNAVMERSANADIVVMCAAVADYRPESVSAEKIKKSGTDEIELRLVRNPDILKALGERKPANQLLIGFALETTNEMEYAAEKLSRKNLDFIVLNSLRDEKAGFKGDENKITILDKNGNTEVFNLKSKKEVASDICKKVLALLK